MHFDVLILGSGLAGQTLALKLADHLKVGLFTKKALQDGASNWAQGGIAAVLSDDDSIEAHFQDTLIAGGGLCEPDSTRFILEHAAENIRWLIEQGVPFTPDDTDFGYHLTREGGHSHRRIIHAADATGEAVQATLSQKVRSHPNITLFEDHIAIELIQDKSNDKDQSVYGAYILDKTNDQVLTVTAHFTALATGGAGKVYLYTTNPDTSTGDGIALGWRAGCSVANMEFIQFHPTCLYHPEAKSFLISEAVRGEGGILKLPNGHRFMPEYDSRAELAPRDTVARSIDAEMKKHGLDCVYLDISHQSPEFIAHHFPNIQAKCMSLGIDITKQPIPVVPAAHYTCGGLMIDQQGHTDLPNLYAAGEVAFTGLHGANRLASNSLLECLVIADSAAKDILARPKAAIPAIPNWDESQVVDADEEVVISHNWNELRHAMWDYVGIVRTTKRLERALNRIALLKQEIQDYYCHFRVSNDLLELRNLVETAELIVKSALQRKESRGLHFSKDYPESSESLTNTVLRPK